MMRSCVPLSAHGGGTTLHFVYGASAAVSRCERLCNDLGVGVCFVPVGACGRLVRAVRVLVGGLSGFCF